MREIHGYYIRYAASQYRFLSQVRLNTNRYTDTNPPGRAYWPMQDIQTQAYLDTLASANKITHADRITCAKGCSYRLTCAHTPHLRNIVHFRSIVHWSFCIKCLKGGLNELLTTDYRVYPRFLLFSDLRRLFKPVIRSGWHVLFRSM